MNNEVINIITRTSNRPNYFKDCYDSVAGQIGGFNEICYWITADDDITQTYLANYDNIRVVPFNRPRRKNVNHFPYNKYLHEVMNLIDNDGWVLILDDDNSLALPESIQKIRLVLEKNNYNRQQVYIWQVKMANGEILPLASSMKNQMLSVDEVTNGCFLFHVIHKDLIQFETKVQASYHVLQTLTKCLKPIWIPEILVHNNNIQGKGDGNRLDREFSMGFQNKVVDLLGQTDEILEDEILEDKILEDEILEDKILEDKILEDEILEDTSEDQILNTFQPADNQASGTKQDTEIRALHIPETGSSPSDKHVSRTFQIGPTNTENDSSDIEIIRIDDEFDSHVNITHEEEGPKSDIIERDKLIESCESKHSQSVHLQPLADLDQISSQNQVSCLQSSEFPSNLDEQINDVAIEGDNQSLANSKIVSLLSILTHDIERVLREIGEMRQEFRNIQQRQSVSVSQTISNVTKQNKNMDSVPVESNRLPATTAKLSPQSTTKTHKHKTTNIDGKQYTITDDSDEDSEIGEMENVNANENTESKWTEILSHFYLITTHRGKSELMDSLSEIASYTLINKNNKSFNQIMQEIVSDCEQSQFKTVAVINFDEVIFNCKFLQILGQQLETLPQDYGLMGFCQKILKGQYQEWGKIHPTYNDYLALYDDLKDMSEDKINSHWKSYGVKELRAPFIGALSSKTEVDYNYGFILNHNALQRLGNILNNTNKDILKRDNIISEYQKNYGNGYYSVPNLTIPRMPKTRIKKICQANGWFANFFSESVR